MNTIRSASNRNQEDRRADDATKPLGALPDSPRYEPASEIREFPLLRSGIPAEIFLFDRGTDRLDRPRRRAV
jgi:hypothetical protein